MLLATGLIGWSRFTPLSHSTAMAPRKRTTNAKNKKNAKMPKLEAFLLDFDDEGKSINFTNDKG